MFRPSPTKTALGAFVAYLLWKIIRSARRDPAYPPGPPTLPLIGNLHLFPTKDLYAKLTDWGREFGDIYTLKIALGTTVVLNSATAVNQVIDKTGWNGSSRPTNYFSDMVTSKNHILFTPVGSRLSAMKKSLRQPFSPQQILEFLPIEQAESAQLLYDMIEKPNLSYDSVERFTLSTIFSVVYGTRAENSDAQIVKDFLAGMYAFEHVATPGNNPPIDLLPFLRYVPDRCAPWVRECNEAKALRDRHLLLLDSCERRMESRKEEDNACVMEQMLRQKEETGLSREDIAYLCVTVCEGGADSSASFINGLILALITHPEVQKRAQQEIDRIVDETRLPELDDIKRMPYIKAIINEMLRIRPPFPIGIPHAMHEDVHYNGYLVPKGATVFTNIWAIFHDPTHFSNPDTFDPERFMRHENGTITGDAPDWRDTIVFGSGRRLCPGMHLANMTIQLATMRLIWAFDFRPKEPLSFDMSSFRNGLAILPSHFTCGIEPRNPQKVVVVKTAFEEAHTLFAKYQ